MTKISITESKKRIKALNAFYTGINSITQNADEAVADSFDSSSDTLKKAGEVVDFLKAQENGGLGQRALDQLSKDNGELHSCKNIKTKTKESYGLTDDFLAKSSQRLSECHRYFVYYDEIKDWEQGQIDAEKKLKKDLGGRLRDLQADEEFETPWFYIPKEMTVDKLAKTWLKSLEKYNFTLADVALSKTFADDNHSSRKKLVDMVAQEIKIKADKLKERQELNRKANEAKGQTTTAAFLKVLKKDNLDQKIPMIKVGK